MCSGWRSSAASPNYYLRWVCMLWNTGLTCTKYISSRDFYGGKGGILLFLEIIFPHDLFFNNELVLSQQLYSTVSWSPSPSIFLKILISLCLVYFLETSLKFTLFHLSDLLFKLYKSCELYQLYASSLHW